MSAPVSSPSPEVIWQVERTFRGEHGRAVAAVARALGDLSLAEDAVADAYAEALRSWPERGLPDNPGAWITATARNRGLDRLRREARRCDKESAAVREARWGDPPAGAALEAAPASAAPLHDDALRLLFACCHPALATDTRTPPAGQAPVG